MGGRTGTDRVAQAEVGVKLSKAQTLGGDTHVPVLVQRAAEVHPHNKRILSLTFNLMFRSLLNGRTVLNTYLT